MSWTREVAVATALCSLAALLVTGPALLGRVVLLPETLLARDRLLGQSPDAPAPHMNDFAGFACDYVHDRAIAGGLHAGRIDQWNPFTGAGAPLWAEQGGPFFPLKLPFWLLPGRTTFDLFLGLRLLFAGLGAYALARVRGLDAAGAWVAAIGFELSGALLAPCAFGNASPLYVLPWLILGAQRLADEPRQRRVGAAALALGLAAHGGHPTLIALVLLAFAVALAGYVAPDWRRPRRVALRLAAGATALGIGLALAAPVLLPLIELAQLGVSYKHRSPGVLAWTWSLHLARGGGALSWAAPGAASTLAVLSASPHAFGGALGAVALSLAAIGVRRRGLDGGLIALLILGVGLTVAPGVVGVRPQTPVLGLILPMYGWPLIALPLSQAAGHGALRLARARDAWLGAAVMLAAALALWWVPDTMLTPTWTALRHAADTSQGWVRLSYPLAVTALFAAVLRLRRRAGVVAAACLLCGAIAAEQCVTIVPALWQPRVTEGEDVSPATRFLQTHMRDGQSRFAGLPVVIGHPMLPMLFGLRDLRNVSALPLERHFAYLQAVGKRAGRFTLQDVAAVDSVLLDRAATRFLAFAAAVVPAPATPSLALIPYMPPQAPDQSARLRQVYRDARAVVYENPHALPRARLTRRITPLAGRQAATAWAVTLGRGEGDAIVGLEPAADGTVPIALDDRAVAEDHVELLAGDDPDRVAVRVVAARDAYLVVADTYHPGWRARLDGQSVPIFPADLLFRAVSVPAGAHTVELEYEPASFRLGVWLAAVGGVLALAMLASRRAVADRDQRTAGDDFKLRT